MTIELKSYPAYKESRVTWLMAIPEHWQVLPARAVYRRKLVKNTGMIENTVLSLSYGRIVVKPSDKLHGLVPESFETYQIVDPGNIILRTTDLQNDRTSLRVGLSNHRGIITSAYMCLETTDLVSSNFGYQFLNACDLLKIIYGYGSGLRQNLEFGDIKQMPVLVPPRPDQSAIVRFLRHADRRIHEYILAKQKLIKLVEEQKDAIVRRAIMRGLNPNVRLKPSGVEWLGEIPEDWGTWQISFFARVGNGSTPSRSNSGYWSGGTYPWLNSASVNQSPIVAANQFVTDIALKECHLPQVQPGSVLVAITGQGKTRGTAAILDIEATINQHIAYITLQRDIISTEFLYLALTAAYRELRRISDDSGSTKGALTCGDLKHFKIPVPPASEQDQIACAIRQQTRSSDALISQVNREIILLREFRTRLIADVVTGKLDVREAAANLPEELGQLVEEAEGAQDSELLSDEQVMA